MKTLIPAHCFTSQLIFDREQSVFGRALWRFGCVAAELKWERDGVLRIIGGLPVWLQRSQGQIHAHCQGAPPPAIAGRDNTSSWTQTAVQHCLQFPESVAEYFPTPIQCAVKGQLVFVKIEAGGPRLDEFLGDWGAPLAEISESFSERFFQAKVEAKTNWKLLVENGFDFTHLEFVHPTTINQVEFDGFEIQGDERWQFAELTAGCDSPRPEELPRLEYRIRHSLMLGTMSARQVAAYQAIYDPIFPERPYHSEKYIHFNLFPNVIITSLMGYFWVLLNFEPVSAENTIIHFHLFPSKQAPGAPELDNHFIHQHALNSLTTYIEDVILQEHLQRMAPSLERPGIFGRLEHKMKAFEAAYLCAMGINLVD